MEGAGDLGAAGVDRHDGSEMGSEAYGVTVGDSESKQLRTQTGGGTEQHRLLEQMPQAEAPGLATDF